MKCVECMECPSSWRSCPLTTQQTRGIELMPYLCWISVEDDGHHENSISAMFRVWWAWTYTLPTLAESWDYSWIVCHSPHVLSLVLLWSVGLKRHFDERNWKQTSSLSSSEQTVHMHRGFPRWLDQFGYGLLLCRCWVRIINRPHIFIVIVFVWPSGVEASYHRDMVTFDQVGVLATFSTYPTKAKTLTHAGYMQYWTNI